MHPFASIFVIGLSLKFMLVNLTLAWKGFQLIAKVDRRFVSLGKNMSMFQAVRT